MTCDGQNLHPMDAMGGDCVLHKATFGNVLMWQSCEWESWVWGGGGSKI